MLETKPWVSYLSVILGFGGEYDASIQQAYKAFQNDPCNFNE